MEHLSNAAPRANAAIQAAQGDQETRPTPRLLHVEQVSERTGMKRSWIYLAYKRGDFPQPIRITPTKCIRWDSDSVDAWINAQIEASQNQQA